MLTTSSTSATTPHAAHLLDVFLAPRSIAVVGASETPGSVGRTLLSNLTTHGFKGPIFPVNRRYTTVLDHTAYPTIAEIPAPVDLALIATPAHTVPTIVAECGQVGVRGAIVLSSGFRERGAAGIALEQQMLAAAQESGLRLLGPNCLGVMRPSIGLNATFAGAIANAGHVGFISQSGALAAAILDWSQREHIGFSAVISAGAMIDVGWGEAIMLLGQDRQTHSIVIYMETMDDARSFISAAREVALNKPIIVLKAGRTLPGARAATLHTGGASGDDAVLDAAFRRCGVLRVNSIAELFAMAEVLAKQPRPRGPRLTILSNAGGPGVLAADALSSVGGELTDLAEQTLTALDQVLPSYWSHSNPIDIGGDADPERYAQALAIAARDPGSDGLLVILTPQAMTDPTHTAALLADHAATLGQPCLVSWMGGEAVVAGEAILNRAGIPTFAYPDSAARAFQAMWRYGVHLRSLYETPQALPAADLPDQAAIDALVQAARQAGRSLLNTEETHQLLAAYALPLDTATLAGNDPADEFVLGSQIDPQFGPVLRFGLGGSGGTWLDDQAIGLPPLTTTLARRLMEQTRTFSQRFIAAERHAERELLEQVLVRFSQLIVEQPWIATTLLNVRVAAGQVAVVAAQIHIYGLHISAASLPSLAIRPYPRHYAQPWNLRDGTPVLIRPIRPEDEPLMVAFHQTLSEKSVFLRYFRPIGLSQRIAHERLAQVCCVDYDRVMVLVAVRCDAQNGAAQILGVGRMCKAYYRAEAEFALLIGDQFQQSGLGSELLRRLIAIARNEGVHRVVGTILAENQGMRHVCRKQGFRLKLCGDTVEAVLDL